MVCCTISKVFFLRPAIWALIAESIFLCVFYSQLLYSMRGGGLEETVPDQPDIVWLPDSFPDDSGESENTKKPTADVILVPDNIKTDIGSSDITIRRGDVVVVDDCGDGYFDDYDKWIPDVADCEEVEEKDPDYDEVSDGADKVNTLYEYRVWFISILSFSLLMTLASLLAQYGYSKNHVKLFLPLVVVLSIKTLLSCYEIFVFTLTDYIIMAIFIICCSVLNILAAFILIIFYKAMVPRPSPAGSIWNLGDVATIVSG